MWRISLGLLFALPLNGQTLSFDKPAGDWMTQAMPIGNGRQGAMVMGGTGRDELQFNDKTLWSGGPAKRGAYQNFGSVLFDFEGHGGEVTDYRRELSLEDAIVRVSYKVGGVRYEREYLASHPDKMVVVRVRSSKPMNFSVRLQGAHGEKNHVDDGRMTFGGQLETVRYAAMLRAGSNGRELWQADDLAIEGATEAVLWLDTQTDYDPAAGGYVMMDMPDSSGLGSFEAVRQRHVADYKALYDRVSLRLPGHEQESLYFQFGRYLMIASSRAGFDLPNNLQGLWCNRNDPPWESDIHSNINIQMNYWPAETANLAECHEPFIHYIYNESQLQPSWRAMAAELGCRGWAIKTQNNIFGYSDWEWNRPANAWYCLHVWDKYLFSPSERYLRDTAWPIMRSACEFWLDRLVLKDGIWLAPNEWSPEHGPWEDGPAYAQQLVYSLFQNTLQAAAVVGDKDFAALLTARMPDNGLHVGSWGQLREWRTCNDSKTDDHRHLSYLIALYPGTGLDGAMAEAARVSLNSRGDEGTGWSRAWKIACWARLRDGDRAHKLLKSALQRSTTTVVSMDSDKGGVYENMLCSHPPFQVDGNFGATAGIAEMLLQSHGGTIELLPALPAMWADGEVRGLCARGGFEVSMKWRGGKVRRAEILSKNGLPCRIRINGQVNEFDTQAGKRYRL